MNGCKRHELLSKGNKKAFPAVKQKPQFWHKKCVNVVGFWYSYIWTGIIRQKPKYMNCPLIFWQTLTYWFSNIFWSPGDIPVKRSLSWWSNNRSYLVTATAMSYTGSLLSRNRYFPMSVKAAAESMASRPTLFRSRYGVASRP